MDHHRAAEIHDPDREKSGTGYLITDNLILTSHHIIAPLGVTGTIGAAYDIRFFGDFENDKTEWCIEGCYLCWDAPEPENDLALLKLTDNRPDFLPQNSPDISFGRMGAETLPTKGYGFPIVQRHGNRQNIEPLEGSLSSLAGKKENRLRMYVKPPHPKNPEQWSGISGTALFVDNALVGVIVETNKGFDEKVLWAVPITVVQDNRAFKEAVFSNRDHKIQFVDLPRSGKPQVTSDALIHVPALQMQRRLIDSHRVFGGRHTELHDFDEQLNVSDKHYHFVTGPAGIGKSALLANWLIKLEGRDEAVCYHFINRNMGMASEQEALQSLCAQLTELHDLGGHIPVGIGELYSRYADLLKKEIPNKRLIVIIDGVDEAEEWTPSVMLFPKDLPTSTKIFFSVRTDSEERREKYLLDFALDRADVKLHVIDVIQKEGISTLIRAAGGHAHGLDSDQKFINKVFDASNGNPFYLRFLVKDIAAGYIDKSNIGEQPKGVDAFLGRWKEDLYEDLDIDQKVYFELLGFFTAALGPLKIEDLMRLSPDVLKGELIDRAISGSLLRYLNGDKDSGYSLCHPLFKDHLRKTMFPVDNYVDKNAFKFKILKYCKNWHSQRSSYILAHYIAHLIEAGKEKEIFQLICQEWKDAHYETSLSTRGFAADVEKVIHLVRAENNVEFFQIFRCSQVYANITTFASNLPATIINCLVSLNRISSALDYSALKRDLLDQTHAYQAAAKALLGLNRIRGIREFLKPAYISLEQMSEITSEDIKKKIVALLDLAELVLSAGSSDLLNQCLHLLQRLVGLQNEPSILSRASSIFRKSGDNSSANFLEEQARAAQESKKSWFDIDFDFSVLSNFYDNKQFRAAFEIESAIEGKIAKNQIQEALEELECELDNFDAVKMPLQHQRNLLSVITRSFLSLNETTRAQATALRLADLRVNDDESFYPSPKAVKLAQTAVLLLRTGCINKALQCATEAVLEIEPEELLNWDMFEELINLFAQAEHTEIAKDLTVEILEKLDNSSVYNRLELLSRFSVVLIRAGAIEKATEVMERLIRETEIVVPTLLKAYALLDLAKATSVLKNSDISSMALLAGQSEMDHFLKQCAAGMELHLLPDILENLVHCKVSIDVEADLGSERHLAEAQDGFNKALALNAIAKGLAKAGQTVQAIQLVNFILVEIINKSEDSKDRRETILDVSNTMLLCKNDDWVIRNVKKIQNLDYNLRDKVSTVLLAANDEGSANVAQDELKRSIQLSITTIETDLNYLLTALEILGERGYADELLERAQYTIIAQLNTQPWNLTSLHQVIQAYAGRGRSNELEKFLLEVQKLETTEKRTEALIQLTSAFIIAEKPRRAARIIPDIFELLERNPKIYIDLSSLAFSLSKLEDRESISKLEEIIQERLNSYVNEDFLLGVLLSYKNLGFVDKIATILKSADKKNKKGGWREYLNAIAWSRAALLYHDMKMEQEASQAAEHALDFFHQELDGSVTPNILVHLVPALIAVQDKDGLLSLLNMSGSKRPYEREYVPAWRRVFPALARLGIFEIDQKHIDALRRGSQNEFDATESEIAIILAEQGHLQSALERANSITSRLHQISAYCGIAKIYAEQGNFKEVTRLAEQAIPNLIGIKNKEKAYSEYCPVYSTKVELLNDFVSLLSQTGIRSEIWTVLRRALLNILKEDFIKIAMDKFRNSIYYFTRHGQLSNIELAEKYLVKAKPEDRVESYVTIVEAFAKAKLFKEVIKRISVTHTAINALADISARAVPLARLANSIWKCEKKGKARELLVDAFNFARLSGRKTFFVVVRYGKDIIASNIDIKTVINSINEIDGWGESI